MRATSFPDTSGISLRKDVARTARSYNANVPPGSMCRPIKVPPG